jgi:hypothetical protein
MVVREKGCHSSPFPFRNDLDEPAVLVGIVIGAHHGGVPARAQLPR